MVPAPDSRPTSPGAAVFLSYAREDSEAARRLVEALRAAGIEAWFDQSELRGGDAWDQKIRRQIKDCTLFLPIVSAHTQARGEGYFRLEWKLAAERTHLMADGVPFLLPIVVDDTPDSAAAVPPEFLRVQWTRLSAGAATPAFVAQVQRLLATPRSAVAAVAPASSRHSGEMAGKMPAILPPSRRRWKWPMTAAVCVGVATVLYFSSTQHQRLAVAAASALDAKSVAVLAFKNLSADKDNEYFSDGLSNNILEKLARVPGLRVMASTSSFSYKGKNMPATQIAQELRVGTLIDGSVQREGQQVRIMAQRVNATDGTQAWSQTFEADLTTEKLFALQDKIALAIAAQLAPSASPAAAEQRPTANLAAYDAYLRGQSADRQGLGNHSRRQAVPLYEEAVRLDPGFALAWAHLAHSLAWIYWGGGDIDGDLPARMQRAMAEAARLQPDLAEVHLARAAVLKADGTNFAEASRELALAEKLKPNDVEIAFEQALVARFSGRLGEALEFCRRATERDPRNPNVYNTRGLVLHFLGRYPEALAAFDQSAALNYEGIPNTNRARTIIRAEGDAAKALREYEVFQLGRLDPQMRTDKIEILSTAGRYADALAEIDRFDQPAVLSQWGYYIRALLAARVREMSGDAEGAQRDYAEALPAAVAYRDQHPQSWRAHPPVAQAAAGLGRKDEALAAAREALRLVPPAENPYYAQLVLLPVLVEVQARIGRMDDALAIVREQIAAGWWRRNDLLLGPQFYFVRRDPRFRALAEKAPL